MRVLLTGGAGFIGHHTFEHFMKNTEDTVIILEGLNYAGSLSRLTDIELFHQWQDLGRVIIVPHNIQFPFNEYVTHKIGSVDAIIHMAAETHVDRSIENPYPFVMTNLLGTFNVLEFARSQIATGLKRFIQVSTDEVYGPALTDEFFKETDRVRPSNPYAATKAGADDLVYSYFKTYGLPAIVTRTMNNFGERQHPEKFLMLTLKALMRNEQVVVHGTPGNIGMRHWLHARNHADAILFLIAHGNNGEFYHIVGDELSNLELADLVASIVHKSLKPKFVDFHACRPGHDRRYAMSDTNLRALGWKPPLSLEESLAKTIQWTLNRPEWLFM
ncbi:GDP-mannose 4,6-dehydratase [Candidatus Falkowbacteria bacterium]|nr:GDP-mannose 4,6-dehydratase [Candidatus Falkowbacteria bacterium]